MKRIVFSAEDKEKKINSFIAINFEPPRCIFCA